MSNVISRATNLNIATGTLPIANGGTGQITAAAAFTALSPITTTGDIIYSSSGTTNSRLGIGTLGQVLSPVSGVPGWSDFGVLDVAQYVGTNPEPGGSSPFQLVSTNHRVQIINPAGAITIKMPTTNLLAGEEWIIINQSTNNVTIQASDASALTIINTGYAVFRTLQATPVANTAWRLVTVSEASSTTGNLTATNFPTTSITIIWARLNNWVEIYVRGASAYGAAATGTLNSALTLDVSGVPSRLYPGSTTPVAITPVYNSGTQQAGPGIATITSGGTANVYKDCAFNNFTATIGLGVGPNNWTWVYQTNS